LAIDNFIPELWAARLLLNMHQALVFAQPGIVNRDYEGEIRDVGDTVRINAIGTVTINDYTKNTDLTAPQELTDAQTTLTINKKKSFNFQVDDVDRMQGIPGAMDGAMREAAFGLANVMDQYLAGLFTDADTANQLGSDGSPYNAPTTSNGLAYENLVDLGRVLDEANVPQANRWLVIPPKYEALLLKDQRFVSFGTVGNLDRLMNRFADASADANPATPAGPVSGLIGRAAGFNIYKSNNVTKNGSVYRIMAGTPEAITVAEQANKVVAYNPEKRFADAVKGLHVWGAKTIRTNCLAVAYVTLS